PYGSRRYGHCLPSFVESASVTDHLLWPGDSQDCVATHSIRWDGPSVLNTVGERDIVLRGPDQRVELGRDVLEAMVRAGAFDSVQPRREALYRLGAMAHAQAAGSPALFTPPVTTPELPPLSVPEQFVWDYQTTRMSTLEIHAVDLVRDQLQELGCVPLLRLRRTPRKTRVTTAGLVVGRQRPGTAKGF